MAHTETSAFMLIKDNKILIEKRKITKKLDPGKIVIPGGHVEDGESPEESMLRELKEEVNLTSKNNYYLCSLLHKTEDGLLRIHYFVVDSWEGSFENNEAE
ncbi:MAG: NUDIX domain-containing protein [Patescibacteria group bacterium]|jgi:8-oxo-dGTP diphosphatase|nr:NUDIX domain-containing protein [Patescibacteria group bacterium]